MEQLTYKECQQLCNDDYDTMIQNDLNAPMPWIGMYIAAASAVCALAMAVDAFKGFKGKKLWFPCKYFSLNAASLTVLTVTMKLTIDLTTSMMGVNDKIASVSSLVMMSTALGNFMTSLASMDNNEILLNLTALAILVITVAANVSIHNVETRDVLDGQVVLGEQIGAIIFMLLLLIVLCSCAIVVPTTKRYIESKYQEVHKIVLNGRIEGGGSFTIDDLRLVLKKHWVMAETGNPQFVMARSVLCVISGGMCLLMALTLIEAHIRMPMLYRKLHRKFPLNSSSYRWSINWILYIQSGGVAIGTIAPLSRWFVAARFHSSKLGNASFKDILKIERYWIQILIEWRERSLPLTIGHRKLRKVLHDAKRLLLNVCIGIQILVVLSGKLVLIFSTVCVAVCFFFFHHIKKLKPHMFKQANDTRASESRNGTELDFSRYVLLLEGEPELPNKKLKNICSEVDKIIEIGKRKQPKNIINLLQKSENFSGVIDFDCKRVRSLHSQEPPNCWSLAVVTLTRIAVALQHITNNKVHQLLNEVREGLSLVKLIEKTMDNTSRDLTSIRNAADVIWVRLELYNKWHDKDIQGKDKKEETHKNTVQELSDIAEKTVEDFKSHATDLVMKNPLNWPVKIIVANSMYRTCQTILFYQRNGAHQDDERMFELLSVMISSILAACFTNLPHVITMKCRGTTIKERGESVRGAAVLLGESEQVIEIVQNRELPGLDLDKAGYIDEWRAFIDQS